ncbi:Neuronal acetylcholine receptor subunit alpha-10 [Portunus trituberculatus]|uniref:Neuronal acetylcholine receptor subunit alpha-10 n=1 Tax=Portunus trituberculatus TaxID=210409 RepID=A0A5B7JUI3_PORTR|nr:Neuronal acetylcholine receptor subunit alpha-10 [Portunus trituberculatus]
MLAMMVFLMAMTENLPPSQTLPVAGVYYGVCLILITFNIVFSVYVLNLSYGGDRGYDVPEWMRKLVLFTARAVYMKIPDFIYESWELNKVRFVQVQVQVQDQIFHCLDHFTMSIHTLLHILW